MNNREVDSTQLGKDRKYLLDSEVSEAHTTTAMPPKGATLETINWDYS